MKTKTFFLLCLLLGMALTQLSAQTRSIVTYDSYTTPPNDVFWVPVVCDGETIDWLWAANYTIKNLGHFKDGNFEWYKSRWTDIVCTSESTGEVFTPYGGEKGGTNGSSDDFIMEIKLNLKGSMGTQYMLHVYINTLTWDWESDTKSNCH